ncbi:MAG: nickel-dependent lactate racemase [Asgard group archaeon]|nr:nickel-dependent lactate racemase [Asgard group archaeon]
MPQKYMDTPIEYGKTIINKFIPKGTNAQVLEIDTEVQRVSDLEQRLDEILNDPIDSPSLRELVKNHYQPGEQVIILTDDNTRPNSHTRLLLPLLYPKLIDYGVKEEDVGILVASGTHRPPTEQEIREQVLGDSIWDKYHDHVMIHNCDEGIKQIGSSTRGTPIYLNEEAISACLLIAMTDSEYHYFAGVAGTVKQIFPGISGRKTISKNHPKAFTKETGFRPECRLGNTEGNPVIQDMIEMVKIVNETKPIFCVDAILHHKEIVHLNAGDIISLHMKARELLKPLREIEVEQGADLTIITTGELGLNLYQADKGIHAAWNATKKGGKILLLARAQDGVGNKPYHETMLAVKDKDVAEALAWVVANKCSEETFRIGNQKPVDLLRILKQNQIDMITEMDHEELKETFRINPVEIEGNVQDTLRQYVKQFLQENKAGLIYVMNDAGLYVKT